MLSVAAPVAAALVLVAVAVALVFSAGRVRDLDDQTRTATDTLTGLVRTGQLPVVLPLPAGSPLLAQVLGADGTVLAASPAASRTLPLSTSLGGTDTDERGAYAGTPLRVRVQQAELAGRAVRVVVAAPLGDVRRALQALRLVLLLVVPLVVLAVTALTWRVAGLALAPVERLRAAAQDAVRSPEAPDALPTAGVAMGDEIGRLAQTLRELLSAVRTLVGQQRAFVADAAHELRSPLASLAVQLDVAREHPTSISVPQLVAELTPEVSRLGRLVADLLALARLGAPDPARYVDLDLTELSREAVGARPVQVTAPGPVPARGDREALQRALVNLLRNAERHATTVRFSTWTVGDLAGVDVDDDGPGIAPEDRRRVLDRWVRLDDARSRQDGGNGLGLAIVLQTARAHGGDLLVLESPMGGARLRLQLPRADRTLVGP